MKTFEIPEHLREQIDAHLARSEVFLALRVLQAGSGCSIPDAKQAIGVRFRERFPDQFRSYRGVYDDD
jgi:hypothetical protein